MVTGSMQWLLVNVRMAVIGSRSNEHFTVSEKCSFKYSINFLVKFCFSNEKALAVGII